MNPSIFSIVSTFLSFLVLMAYYYTCKPDFVMETDSTQKKVLSIRLSLIYSLLFSSSIGLLVLGISSILQNYKSSSSSSDESSSSESSSSESSSSESSSSESNSRQTMTKNIYTSPGKEIGSPAIKPKY